MIDILIPVLNRPDNAPKVVESIRNVTTVDHSIVFICSQGDEAEILACKQTGARILIHDFGQRSEYPKKMNFGFSKTDRDFCLLGADDIDFTKNWDLDLLRMASDTGKGVIGNNDCANPQVMRGDFSTHPLVRRSYVMEQGASLDGPGVLIHEGYDHNYCDRELCHLAQSRGQWAFAENVRICHRHPSWGTAKSDQVYAKGRRAMQRDHYLFMRRARLWGGVGLLSEELPGRRRSQRRR